MRIAVYAALMVVNFVLQTTLFEYISVFGGIPDTAIILIVSAAVLRGDAEGAVFGFFTGLLWDIFFTRYFGMYILLYTLTGYFSGKPFKNYYRENYILPFCLVITAKTAAAAALYVILFLLRGETDVIRYFAVFILPGLIYTAVAALPVYKLVMGINNRLESYERKKESLF